MIRLRNPGAPVQVVKVEIRTSECSQAEPLFATLYATTQHKSALEFWRLTGTGISSRFAEHVLRTLSTISFAPIEEGADEHIQCAGTASNDDRYSPVIRQRIAHLLQRASPRSEVSGRLSPKDVYLYPTGMSAIYHCNRLLGSWRASESIVFGFLYELTPKLLQTYAHGFHFFGFGTENELNELEERLRLGLASGHPIQSVWCECPSNPLLHTVNFRRLRQLADAYEFVLVVDETIGTFANVSTLR